MEKTMLFQELRSVREARHISLSQISEATRIGVQFLEAIEQGNTSVLPQTYMRAFIREYATVIGLNPTEIMQKYDDAIRGSANTQEEPAHPESLTGERASPLQATSTPTRKFPSPRVVRIAMVGVVLCAAAIGLWNLVGKESPIPTEEIPFQTVIKENEQRVTSSASVQQAAPYAPAPGPVDSLILRAVVTDSVWVRIVVDGQQPREYLFAPNAKALWKARDRFVLTLGNAGGMLFTLNRKQLGALGKRGAVIRNAELNRQMLTKN